MSHHYAGIIRISDLGGRKVGSESLHSDRDQEKAIRDALPQGATLEILEPEYDVSGGLPLERRPSLQRAVLGVEAGDYVGIIVAYQSRLGRDVEQEESVWRRVEDAGGHIILALDGVDTATVDGKMVRRIRGAINHAERERHVVRFEELRKWATEAGVWQTRRIPLGYVKNPATRHLEIDPATEGQVRQAFHDRAAGRSIRQIALDLGMSPTGASGLLANRVYRGEVRQGGNRGRDVPRYLNPDAHPAIVTEEEFQAAQGAQPRPPRGAGGPMLLAGLVRCAGCGHLMAPAGRPRTYACAGGSAAGRCPEPAGVAVHLLDALVEAAVRPHLAELRIETADRRGRIDEAAEALKTAERELTGYLTAVSVEAVGADHFKAGAETRRNAVTDATDTYRRELALQPQSLHYGSGADILDGSAHERNRVLRALLDAVVVQRAGGRGGGTGCRTPLVERVRILEAGSGLALLRRNNGDRPLGIEPISFADLDPETVLRVPSAENVLDRASSTT